MPKHDETDPLQPKKTTNFGRLAVAAAALSFLLGAAAATAVRGSGLRGSDLHETVETSKSANTLIKLASDPTIGRGAYEVAAGVLELVREFLHPLVELLHLRENQPSRITAPTSQSRAVEERLQQAGISTLVFHTSFS